MTLVVLTATAPPCVVHESGDVSGTVGWVGVTQAGKDLFTGITMEEINVHAVCLSILRKTAIPLGLVRTPGAVERRLRTYRQTSPTGSD